MTAVIVAARACLLLMMTTAATLARTCEAQRSLKYFVQRFPTVTQRQTSQTMCTACFVLRDSGGFRFCQGSPNGVMVGNDVVMSLLNPAGGLAPFQCSSLRFYRITQFPTTTSMGGFESASSLPSEFASVGFLANLWAPNADDTVGVTAENKLQTVLELDGFPSYFSDTVAENGAVGTGRKTYPQAPATDYTYQLDPDGVINSFLLSSLPVTNTLSSAVLFYLNTTAAAARYRVFYTLFTKSSQTGGYTFYGFEAAFSATQSGSGRRRLLQSASVDQASLAAAQTTCTLVMPPPNGCNAVSCRRVCR